MLDSQSIPDLRVANEEEGRLLPSASQPATKAWWIGLGEWPQSGGPLLFFRRENKCKQEDELFAPLLPIAFCDGRSPSSQITRVICVFRHGTSTVLGADQSLSSFVSACAVFPLQGIFNGESILQPSDAEIDAEALPAVPTPDLPKMLPSHPGLLLRWANCVLDFADLTGLCRVSQRQIPCNQHGRKRGPLSVADTGRN